MSNPSAFLDQIRSKLANNGIVFIDVPHSDFIYKKEVFPHLLFFSVDSLSRLLQKVGFSLICNDGWGRNRDSFLVNAYNHNKIGRGALLKKLEDVQTGIEITRFLSFKSKHDGSMDRRRIKCDPVKAMMELNCKLHQTYRQYRNDLLTCDKQ